MRVLHIVPCYMPAYRYGGPIKSVHELCVKLVESGLDVTVFTTNADGPENLDVPVGEEVNINGVKVFYFPLARPRSFFRSPQLLTTLIKRIYEFDLIHIHWLYVYPTLVVARECRKLNVPYIISPRGMLDPYSIARKSYVKKKLYISLIEKKNLESAKAVHFTSADEQRLAKTLGINFSGFIVPNGLNLRDYPDSNGLHEKSEYSPDREMILFLSRIHPQKGLDLLIKAFAVIAQERPRAKLVIAGPDNSGYMGEIETLITQYGLNGKVTYMGMLEGKKKIDAFRNASVFVLPSYSENFGMAVAEAMACSRPVVITDRVNICHDVAEYKAGLITSCNPQEIAEAIIRILENPQLGREMGMNGRRLVEERFNWDMAASKMIMAYKDILKDKVKGEGLGIKG
ncbi:MAG: glycosyltransferase [Nitrospirae bacterium]|nr:glycosyltransferase [Nitrospirota bacterium]